MKYSAHFFLFIMLGSAFHGYCDVPAEFAGDDAYAKSLADSSGSQASSAMAGKYSASNNIKGYTSDPSEVKYQHGEGIASAAKVLMNNPKTGGPTVTSHFQNAPHFTINKKSPEIARAKLIQENSQGIATGKYSGCTDKTNSKTHYTTQQCEKSEIKTVACTRARNPYVYIPEHPLNCSHPGWGGGTPAGAKKIGTYYVHGTHCYHKWFHKVCHDTYTANDIYLLSGANSENECTVGYTVGASQNAINVPKNVSLKLKTMGWSGIDSSLVASAKLSNGVSLTGKDRAISSTAFTVKDEHAAAAQSGQQLTLSLSLSGNGNHSTGLAWVTEPIVPKPFVDMDRFTVSCDQDTIDSLGCVANGGEVCTSKPNETRYVGGIQLTSSCWSYQQNYTCGNRAINTCQPFINQGCSEVASECKTPGQSPCLDYNVTYSCPQTSVLGKGIACGSKFFCLSGNCTKQNPSQESAKDFNKAVSSLAAVSAMGKKVSDLNTQDGNNIRIFSGHALECSESAAGFLNCCRGSGWGHDINLAHCSQQEKDLGKARQSARTIALGSYCHNKVLGACTDHHEVFCVFDSRLAETIQDQGMRAQEGKSFGGPKSANCSGLTPDELAGLDLSKIDFSFMVNDSAIAGDSPDQSKAEEEIKDRIRQMGGDV